MTACLDSVCRVYNLDTTGEPRTTFEEHCTSANDVSQVEEDLVVSVGSCGLLFSWRPTTGELVEEWRHDEWKMVTLTSVTKLVNDKVLVGDNTGNLIVMTHEAGTTFQLFRTLLEGQFGCFVSNFAVHSDFIVACSCGLFARIWDATSFALLATLRPVGGAKRAVVNDKYIVITSHSGGKVYAYLTSDDYPFDSVITMRNAFFQDVAFLREDVVVVSADESIYFISLSSKSTQTFLSFPSPF